MIFTTFILIVALCMQDAVVFSQQQPSFGHPAQGWNSQSWATPYFGASNSWMDYIKSFQQLYKQWEKAGGPNMFAMGMDYAQQVAKEFEKATAQHGQQGMVKVPFF